MREGERHSRDSNQTIHPLEMRSLAPDVILWPSGMPLVAL